MTPSPVSSGVERQSQRSFGLSAGLVCAFLAWQAGRHGHPAAAWVLGGAGLIVTLLGSVAPSRLRGPSLIWWKALHALGALNARLILTILFFLVVTPMGIAMRVAGRDPLARRKARGRRTGWAPYPERLRNPRHYERMY